MLVEGAFLQAIIADPDDDAPRLIYADWLDEQGECERAEFIRVQCALARMKKTDPDWKQLWDRERDLIVFHSHLWSVPLRRFVTAFWCRRGFVEDVTVDARTFITSAAELFAIAPILSANVWNGADVIEEFANCPYLAGLRRLTLTSEHVELIGDLGGEIDLATVDPVVMSGALEDDGLIVLLRSPYLAHLVSLDLAYHNIGVEGVRALTEASHLDQLSVLDLSHNPLGIDSAILLAGWPGLARLTRLNLTGCRLRVWGRRIASSPHAPAGDQNWLQL